MNVHDERGARIADVMGAGWFTKPIGVPEHERVGPEKDKKATKDAYDFQGDDPSGAPINKCDAKSTHTDDGKKPNCNKRRNGQMTLIVATVCQAIGTFLIFGVTLAYTYYAGGQLKEMQNASVISDKNFAAQSEQIGRSIQIASAEAKATKALVTFAKAQAEEAKLAASAAAANATASTVNAEASTKNAKASMQLAEISTHALEIAAKSAASTQALAEATVKSEAVGALALRTSQEQFVKDQRPFVWTKPRESFDPKPSGNGLRIYLDIGNSGKTPAIKASYQIVSYAFLPKPIETMVDSAFKANLSNSSEMPIGIMPPSQNLGAFATASIGYKIDAPGLASEMSTDRAIVIAGRIRYRDRAGTAYSTDFCADRLADGTYTPCDKHNDVR